MTSTEWPWGAVQTARGQYLGSGVENLWNAYSAWATLRMPLLAVAFIGFGLYRIAAGDPLAPGVSLLFYALSAREMARGKSDEPAG
jgi:hypothetical protein